MTELESLKHRKRKASKNEVFDTDAFLGSWSDKDYVDAGVVVHKKDYYSQSSRKSVAARRRIVPLIFYIAFCFVTSFLFHVYSHFYYSNRAAPLTFFEDFQGDVKCSLAKTLEKDSLNLFLSEKQKELCISIDKFNQRAEVVKK